MERKAISARPLQDQRIEVTRSDGSSIVVDVRPYLERGVFAALRNSELFAQVSIDALGGAEWPNGASLPPELLSGDQANLERNTDAVRAS